MSTAWLYCGDAISVLRRLPDESVRCVVTSPPYWGLRDYGLPVTVFGSDEDCEHTWGLEIRRGGSAGKQGSTSQRNGRRNIKAQERQDDSLGTFCTHCGAWRGALGLEPTPDLYIEHMVMVFRESRRVLAKDGTLWLNMGDCYATGAGRVGEHPGGGEQGARWKGDVNRVRDAKRGYRGDRLVNTNSADTERPKTAAMGPMTQPNRMPLPGLKPKDLVMMPARLALALQADGWWLRSTIIWQKPNPMPESVRDRPTTAHEYVFLLAKSERYYYDGDAIAERLTTDPSENYPARAKITGRGTQAAAAVRGNDRDKSGGFPPKKKPVAGWATGDGDHSTLEHNKPRKGSGNKARKFGDAADRPASHVGRSIPWENDGGGRNARSVWTISSRPYKGAHFATFPEALAQRCILAGSAPGDTILDPFGGSGTVAQVATGNARNAIYIDLNPDYLDLAQHRIGPMLCEVVA